MRKPRFRLAWLMVVIALVALNFGVIRTVYDLSNANVRNVRVSVSLSAVLTMLVLGALPMANVLAVGLVISRRYSRSRSFLVGFVAFGATVLALCLAGLSLLTDELASLFFNDFLRPFINSMLQGRRVTITGIAMVYSAFGAVLVLPQVALALIGGFLSRKRPRLWFALGILCAVVVACFLGVLAANYLAAQPHYPIERAAALIRFWSIGMVISCAFALTAAALLVSGRRV